ncbi:MAG: Alkaline phosphatase synthesis sensor protein PhoR [Betaproteobacteria bacterium ADurb.Bin341]|nr:MAG: Alkaline phosphatase synthesis sensor protein PhoR [Betaproteobacteria bacterium ADurb.Bin341]
MERSDNADSLKTGKTFPDKCDEADKSILYGALVASLSDMGQGLVIIENRRFAYVNQAICAMTGYSEEELLGLETFVPLFHPEERQRVLERHIRRISGEQFDTCYETAFLHRDGLRRIDVEMSVAFLRSPNRHGVVVTVRDISERKQIEEQIRRKNEDLEQLKIGLEKMVRDRMSELEKANKQLIRLNQIKSDFISIVSHELRTPLTSIKSFAEIMLDDLGKHDQETQRRYLSIINSESDRLSRLISDILDLQKIDSGKIDWHDEMINVVEVVRRAVDTFSGAFVEKGLSLSFESAGDCMMTEAAPDRIFQVVANLLSNGLKFTEHGGVEVNIRLVEAPYEGSAEKFIRISVRDTGTGIPQEELSRIFERFYQIDQSQGRKHEGAGLGLSISKDIIDHYRGRITVESVPGSGSIFCVLLPEQEQPRKKLGEVLVELGMLTETELVSALEKQS